MSRIHSITSSKFVQVGSRANFKSGITSSKLSTSGAIFAEGFKDLGIASSTTPLLTVGTQSSDGSFDECVTFTNTDFRLTASGSFNHFTFIEKRTDGWFQISTGSLNGLVKKDFVDIDGNGIDDRAEGVTRYHENPINKKSPHKKSGFKMKSSPVKIYNKAGKRRKNYKY